MKCNGDCFNCIYPDCEIDFSDFSKNQIHYLNVKNKQAIYKKSYYRQNRDKIIERVKAWKKANPERYKQTQKRAMDKYRETHREERKAYLREYYQKHKEERKLEYQLKKRLKNDD